MTTTSTLRAAALLAAAALTVGAAACGGGSSDTASAEEISATLAIISTNIETDRDARGFEAATEGETLTAGDRVKTDQTGFAELTYHDGSWQRIENSATLTIDELTNAGDTNTVRTSVDVGDTWNRVETLTEPDDTYELDTPVATAAVRGTAFATSCPTADECTFSVIEGTVEITPRTGDPVTLTAGQQITITADTPPPVAETPGVDTLSQDPFIARNLDLDQTKTTETGSDSGDGAGQGEGASGGDDSLVGTWVTADGVTEVVVTDADGGGFELRVTRTSGCDAGLLSEPIVYEEEGFGTGEAPYVLDNAGCHQAEAPMANPVVPADIYLASDGRLVLVFAGSKDELALERK